MMREAPRRTRVPEQRPGDDRETHADEGELERRRIFRFLRRHLLPVERAALGPERFRSIPGPGEIVSTFGRELGHRERRLARSRQRDLDDFLSRARHGEEVVLVLDADEGASPVGGKRDLVGDGRLQSGTGAHDLEVRLPVEAVEADAPPDRRLLADRGHVDRARARHVCAQRHHALEKVVGQVLDGQAEEVLQLERRDDDVSLLRRAALGS